MLFGSLGSSDGCWHEILGVHLAWVVIPSSLLLQHHATFLPSKQTHVFNNNNNNNNKCSHYGLLLNAFLWPNPKVSESSALLSQQLRHST
jgi:hypothetical protein